MDYKNECKILIEQQQNNNKNTPAFMVGEQLKDIISNNELAAELVAHDLKLPEMSLEKAADEIKKYADRHKKQGQEFVCVPPNIAENIICKFYGIDKSTDNNGASKNSFVNLADFM